MFFLFKNVRYYHLYGNEIIKCQYFYKQKNVRYKIFIYLIILY